MKMFSRLHWLWRHYGVRRLLLIGLACPLYHLTRLLVAFTTASPGSPGTALERLTTGAHDLWFGFWIATMATPLLWIASYRISVVRVKWGFRAIAFAWLFDGVVAMGQAVWLLGTTPGSELNAVLRAWAWLSVVPAGIGVAPWVFMEAWELIRNSPLYLRWRYSGLEVHAAWISSRKLYQHTQPLPGKLIK